MPTVSVLIAAYNPPQNYIHETLKSVFNQTFQDFEVIIVDDGSSIDTKDILAPFKNRIRYYYKENGGQNSARLFGLDKAKGKYIALVDQDDIWVPDKLQKQVEFLENYSELDFIFSDFYNWFEEDGFNPVSFLDKIKVFRKIPTVKAANGSSDAYIFPKNILYDYVKGGSFILQSTVMARKKICKKYDMFKTKTNGREFWEFGLRTFHLLKIGFINEILMYRRIHGNNFFLNHDRQHKVTSIICEDALRYPWMDSRCKAALRQELSKTYFRLGVGYWAKGNFPQSRAYFKTIMNHDYVNLLDIPRYYLQFSPKVWVMLGKSFLKLIFRTLKMTFSRI